MLYGLNDQDIPRWYSITDHRQADIGYGLFRVHFVLSPNQVASAAKTSLAVGGRPLVVATVAQALVDEIQLMPWGLDYAETVRVLRTALETRSTSEEELVETLRHRPSVAAARRLGLLLELVTSRRNPELLDMARSNRGVTRLANDSLLDSTWRLHLPRTRADIVRASR
jgi:hypothetical protein